MSQKIKVHIAEDHQIIIDGIVSLINNEEYIEVEGYSLTGKEVLDWSKNNNADVLILDISMPEIDGIDVLRAFKKRNLEIKTIIFSSFDDPKLVQEMILLGAIGFIDKGSASNHIISAIKSVSMGVQYFSEDVKNSLLNLYVSEAKSDNKKEKEKEDLLEKESLTEREIEVLRQVALEKNSTEIAEYLMVSVKTVETYRKSIYKKLNIKTIVGLAVYAVKNNII